MASRKNVLQDNNVIVLNERKFYILLLAFYNSKAREKEVGTLEWHI